MDSVSPANAARSAAPTAPLLARPLTSGETGHLDRLRAWLRADGTDAHDIAALDARWARLLETHPVGAPAPAGVAAAIGIAVGDLLVASVADALWMMCPGPEGATPGVLLVDRPHMPVLPVLDAHARWRVRTPRWTVDYVERAVVHLQAGRPQVPTPHPAPEATADAAVEPVDALSAPIETLLAHSDVPDVPAHSLYASTDTRDAPPAVPAAAVAEPVDALSAPIETLLAHDERLDEPVDAPSAPIETPLAHDDVPDAPAEALLAHDEPSPAPVEAPLAPADVPDAPTEPTGPEAPVTEVAAVESADVRQVADELDAEPVDAEPVSTKPVDTEPIGAEPSDTEPSDTEPVDPESVVAESVDTEQNDVPVDEAQDDAALVEAAPVDAAPSDAVPVGAEPVGAEPHDDGPVDTDPVADAVADPQDETRTPTTAPDGEQTAGQPAAPVADAPDVPASEPEAWTPTFVDDGTLQPPATDPEVWVPTFIDDAAPQPVAPLEPIEPEAWSPTFVDHDALEPPVTDPEVWRPTFAPDMTTEAPVATVPVATAPTTAEPAGEAPADGPRVDTAPADETPADTAPPTGSPAPNAVLWEPVFIEPTAHTTLAHRSGPTVAEPAGPAARQDAAPRHEPVAPTATATPGRGLPVSAHEALTPEDLPHRPSERVQDLALRALELALERAVRDVAGSAPFVLVRDGYDIEVLDFAHSDAGLAQARDAARGSRYAAAAVAWTSPADPTRPYPRVVVDASAPGRPGIRVAHSFTHDEHGGREIGGPQVVGQSAPVL